jgi:topoisomerase IV subunit A
MADETDDPDMPDPEVPVSEIPEPLSRALGDRYLTYALSTIMHRALPDARDGLKPVHRRILYAMRGLRLDPNGAFRKCAKIVGEVMGNYHPHGDQAIYDALVRLAQDFAVRYPLVDGQGNFGNIDGDNPAAQRYTEARLTAAAEALMEGLAEDAVDFRDNYDGSEREPVVLPAAFPNLLANGSSGIAVGMATNIPPHNLDEVVNAALHLVKHPGASDEKLLDFVQGPDFPTGGVCVEPRAAIREAYRTGRGSFRLRARWEVEDLGRGTWQVVVTEIPYQVQKGKLIERIAELINLKKVPILADVRDESTADVRVVLEPRARTVDPAAMMETLFRLTDLETRFAMNMNVLIDGRVPKVSTLKEVLRAFLDHRRDVLERRARFRLGKIEARLEVLEGLLVAYLNLDRVIEIIRTEDEPKAVMMAEFALSDVQAEAILNMRLRNLRKLEEMEIRGERERLVVEREALWRCSARRSCSGPDRGGAARGEEAVRPRCAGRGAAHRVRRRAGGRGGLARGDDAARADHGGLLGDGLDPGAARASRGGCGAEVQGWGRAAVLFACGDDGSAAAVRFERAVLHACLRGLPGGRGMGEPVRLMVDLPNEAEMVALRVHRPGGRLIVASSAGDGFVVPEDEAVAQTRGGRQVMNVRDGVRARVCRPVAGDHVAVVGENRKLLIFPLSELPEMGRGKGVRLQKYKDGGLADATTFVLAEGLIWKDPAGRTRTETALGDWIGARAGAGRMAPRGFPRENRFTG